MNKITMAVTVATIGVAITGCQSFKPLEMDATARDAETYKCDVTIPTMPREKIVIVNKISKTEADSEDKYFVDRMENALASVFTNLGCFDTIDRKNGMTVDSEAILAADKNGVDPTKVAGASKVLIAETTYNWHMSESLNSRTTFDPGKGYAVAITTNFRMIDLKSKETVITKTVSSMAGYTHGTDGWMQGVNRATEENARKFARIVSAKMLPPAKVLQTRGSGYAAQISMGKNFMSDPGQEVEFLAIEEDGPMAFARGTVRIADDKRSWVEVNNYEKAGVKKGHFVKLVAEDKE